MRIWKLKIKWLCWFSGIDYFFFEIVFNFVVFYVLIFFLFLNLVLLCLKNEILMS